MKPTEISAFCPDCRGTGAIAYRREDGGGGAWFENHRCGTCEGRKIVMLREKRRDIVQPFLDFFGRTP